MDRLKFLIRAGAAGLASWFATFSYGVEQVAAPSEVNLVIADPHAYVFQFFGIHIPARTTSPLELLQEVKVELAARSPQLEIRPTSAAKAACFSNTSLDRTLKCYTLFVACCPRCERPQRLPIQKPKPIEIFQFPIEAS